MLTRLLLGAALLAAAAPAHAEDWDFVLVNHTGQAIKTIEVSDTGKDQWAQEQLEEGMVHDPVRAGASHTVRFDKSGCSIDVRVTYPDGTQSVFTKFNACDNPIGDFSLKNGVPVARGT
jgi:hypothetical protein